MATGCSFIRSQRDKNKLVSEGYIYKVDCVRDEKSYWVCHLPDCKCRCIQTADELRYTHKLSNHLDYKTPWHMYMYLCLLKAKWWYVRSENKAILTLKKIFLFILFLGKSLSVSVGECRWVFKKIVCDLSCRPVVVSANILSVKKCRRRVVVSANCLSVSYHRFVLVTLATNSRLLTTWWGYYLVTYPNKLRNFSFTLSITYQL